MLLPTVADGSSVTHVTDIVTDTFLSKLCALYMYDLFAQLATINNDQGYMDVQTMGTVPSNERKLKCSQMIQTSMKTAPDEHSDIRGICE